MGVIRWNPSLGARSHGDCARPSFSDPFIEMTVSFNKGSEKRK
jgi:hypothetical protein